jgi:hypothetical protein
VSSVVVVVIILCTSGKLSRRNSDYNGWCDKKSNCSEPVPVDARHVQRAENNSTM